MSSLLAYHPHRVEFVIGFLVVEAFVIALILAKEWRKIKAVRKESEHE